MIISLPTLMLVALAVFLLGHGQLDTQTNPQTQLHAILMHG